MLAPASGAECERSIGDGAAGACPSIRRDRRVLRVVEDEDEGWETLRAARGGTVIVSRRFAGAGEGEGEGASDRGRVAMVEGAGSTSMASNLPAESSTNSGGGRETSSDGGGGMMCADAEGARRGRDGAVATTGFGSGIFPPRNVQVVFIRG